MFLCGKNDTVAYANGIGACMVIVSVKCDNISPFPIVIAACQKTCDLRA